MIDTKGAPSQYLLFDLNGQQVAVTDLQIDSKGLRTSWVVLGKRLYTDEQTDAMLSDAFKFLFENAEQPIPEEPEPEPDLKKPIWRTLLTRIRELL